MMPVLYNWVAALSPTVNVCDADSHLIEELRQAQEQTLAELHNVQRDFKELSAKNENQFLEIDSLTRKLTSAVRDISSLRDKKVETEAVVASLKERLHSALGMEQALNAALEDLSLYKQRAIEMEARFEMSYMQANQRRQELETALQEKEVELEQVRKERNESVCDRELDSTILEEGTNAGAAVLEARQQDTDTIRTTHDAAPTENETLAHQAQQQEECLPRHAHEGRLLFLKMTETPRAKFFPITLDASSVQLHMHLEQ